MRRCLERDPVARANAFEILRHDVVKRASRAPLLKRVRVLSRKARSTFDSQYVVLFDSLLCVLTDPTDK